jgi:hypothetical protein
VQHPEENDPPGFNAVEDSVRKLRNERAPHITVDLREHLRIVFDGIKGRIGSAEKPFAKAFDLIFVVREGVCKISSDPAAVDERQRH